MIWIPIVFLEIEEIDLRRRVLEYVNSVLEEMVRTEIELMRDEKIVFPDEIPFIIKSMFPAVMVREDSALCEKRLYELYDLIRSPVVRFEVKAVYRLALFRCIEDYLERAYENENIDELPLPVLDERTQNQLLKKYGQDMLDSITMVSNYPEIVFDDLDFLPESVNLYAALSMDNPTFFQMSMSYQELDEYVDLMEQDLRDRYLQFRKANQESLCTFEQALQQNIYKALISIQNNKLYYGKTEDEINDGIRDILSIIYDVKDQSRRGESAYGDSSGEVDLLIYENGIPFAIVEALKVDGVNRQYIKEHIDKVLYAYDPVGYTNAFILLYVTAKDFNQSWEKCILLFSEYSYCFPVVHPLQNIDLPYAESKHAMITLDRNGKPVILNYYAIHLR